jgi:hypothetical protein
MSREEGDILFIVFCFSVYLFFGGTGLSVVIMALIGIVMFLLPSLLAGAFLTGALKGGYFHFTPAFGVFLLLLAYIIYKWLKK